MSGCQRPGTYGLILIAEDDFSARVGALGVIQFARGYHIYVGSALGPGGLEARVKHHLRHPSHPHWHLDYLREHMTARSLWYAQDTRRLEHGWAHVVAALPGASPIPRFGSSHCRCQSHFFGFSKPPSVDRFRRALRGRISKCPRVCTRALSARSS